MMLQRIPAVQSNCQQIKKYHRHVSVSLLVLENTSKRKIIKTTGGKRENESSLKLHTNACKQILNP